MDRRRFLKTAVPASVGASLAACGPGASSEGGPAVHTRKRISWRLASSFPRALDTIFGASEVLAERLSEMSGGRFSIRVYPAGELVPGLQVMDAVQQGTVHIGQTASYYFIGKNPALAFDCCVPFGMTSRQQAAWLTQGGGLELLRGLFADFGIVNFPAGNTGSQMGGWFKRPIDRAEDLRGLKMRIPGLGGDVMSRLGATVQVLAGGDIYPALERGAIDATEWVGPYDDEKLGFHEVAKHYYYPGWWEPGPSLSYHVQQKAWDTLGAEDQAMFSAAAAESASVMQARYDARNPEALTRLLAAGVDLRPFSTDLLAAAYEASQEMLEEQAAADPTYRRIYEAWSKARTDMVRWFSASELAYSRFVAER